MKNKIKKAAVMVVGISLLGLNACHDEMNIEQEVEFNNSGEFITETGIVEGSYIVIFNNSFIDKSTTVGNSRVYRERNAAMRDISTKVLESNSISTKSISNVYSEATYGFSAELAIEEVEWLKKDPKVAFIEPDYYALVGKGGKKGGENGGDNPQPAQQIDYGVARVGGPVNGTGKTAWVMDTGIDSDHPDLNVDLTRSKSFMKGKEGKTIEDFVGHGTHVSGIIGAVDNTIGYAGVAANATIVALKVCVEGSCTLSGMIAAIDYMLTEAQPGDVVNMSLRIPASEALDNAVINAANQGILFSVAAGNDTYDAVNYSPARVDHPNVYTVSNIDEFDMWYSESNFGENVDFCAPGVYIISTTLNGDYGWGTGTSMSTPHVTGVLLMTGGAPNSDGYAIGDPDGNPDPIIHL